jgi:hypothetical protein
MRAKDVGGAIGLFEALLKKSWEIGAQTAPSMFDKHTGQRLKGRFSSGLHI